MVELNQAIQAEQAEVGTRDQVAAGAEDGGEAGEGAAEPDDEAARDGNDIDVWHRYAVRRFGNVISHRKPMLTQHASRYWLVPGAARRFT